MLAEILARDVMSIMAEDIEAAGITVLVTGRPNQNTVVNEKVLEQRRLSIEDIPDEAVQKILELSFMETQPLSIRLVNKRLATLSLPFTFRNIYADSPGGLRDLIPMSFSPLYYERLGKYVRLFELGFLAEEHELPSMHYDIPFSLPNLATVRLRFTYGIPTDTIEEVQKLLSEDTIIRSTPSTFGNMWLQFLAMFQPKRFEWISNEPQNLHLLGVYRDLRSLFKSWKSLTSIYLEGICLIEQSHLSTWTLAFLAERIHIWGFPISDEFFLEGLASVRYATPCRMPLLEALKPEKGSQLIRRNSTTPVIAFGTMMVSLKGRNATSRLLFLHRLTKHSRQQPPAEVGPQMVENTAHAAILRPNHLHIISGIFFGLLFSITMKDSFTPTPHIGMPYSTRSIYSEAARASRHFTPGSYYYDKTSLSPVQVFRFTWSPLKLALRSSNDGLLLTFVPT